MDNETRLFFVTTFGDRNEEIFETLEEAREYLKATSKERNARRMLGLGLIRVAIVRHAYKETIDGKEVWNYEDLSDTFEFIKNL